MYSPMSHTRGVGGLLFRGPLAPGSLLCVALSSNEGRPPKRRGKKEGKYFPCDVNDWAPPARLGLWMWWWGVGRVRRKELPPPLSLVKSAALYLRARRLVSSEKTHPSEEAHPRKLLRRGKVKVGGGYYKRKGAAFSSNTTTTFL